MRKITILSNTVNTDMTHTVNAAFWLDVPVKVRKASPTFVSEVSDADASEMVALTSGTVLEKVVSVNVNDLSDYRAILRRMYVDEQKSIDDQGSKQNHAGRYWDGDKWVNP